MRNGIITRMFYLAATLLLMSCQKEITYTTRINNYTQESIIFEVFTIYSQEPEYISVFPGKSQTLFIHSEKDGNNAPAYCGWELDSVNAVVLGGRKLTKDIMDPAEWTQRTNESNHTRKVEHFCDFDINIKDLSN